MFKQNSRNSMQALKRIVERHLNFRFLGRVPYSIKLGRNYKKESLLIEQFSLMPQDEKVKWILFNLNMALSKAIRDIPFYRHKYSTLTLPLKDMQDYYNLPLLSKEEVRELYANLKGSRKSFYETNTGGSTGTPLTTLQPRNIWSREWAHMHSIWKKNGYREDQLMLTLMGRNLGQNLFVYNPVHNEIKFNTYLNLEGKSDEILSLLSNNIEVIQAYPSTLYSFLNELKRVIDADMFQKFTEGIELILLSSEMTPEYMRKYFRATLPMSNLVTWYGHSEMCLLAAENNECNYETDHLYGFTEIINGELIGSSYRNPVMPLFRYKTGDSASVVKSSNGIVEVFSLREGRLGEYIYDRSGSRISLTSLIYGRHHQIFNKASSVQVKQIEQGSIEVYVCSDEIIEDSLENLFDFSDVQLEVKIKQVKSPFLTKNGKQMLLIK